MGQKILALVAEPISGEALESALGPEVREAEVMVVAPATTSRFRWLVDDTDAAIERAEAVQEETVERLGEDGVDAAGDTGESDPLLALQDVLQTFPADQVVLFTHSGGKRNWLEEGVVDRARERFDVPVTHMTVE
jgi:GABA permease